MSRRTSSFTPIPTNRRKVLSKFPDGIIGHPVASNLPPSFNPVFHQEYNDNGLENMMSISAMPGFRHRSVEELRVADWNLDRQLKAAEVLETERLQALRLNDSEGDATRTQKKEGLFDIPGSPETAGPSNKATCPPPGVPFGQTVPLRKAVSSGQAVPLGQAVPSGQAVPLGQVAPSLSVFKGTEIKGPGIAGPMSGTASIKAEGRKPTSPSSSPSSSSSSSSSTSSSPSSSSCSSNLGFARFNLPEGHVSLVPPKLGTGTGKSDQDTPLTKPLAKDSDVPSLTLHSLAEGAAVVPPTLVPASPANSAPPQVHNAPQPSGLGSQTDASPITFPLSPAAEQSSTVADAEKEWVHASRQAHEAKAQLAKAQAARDQAVAMENLKFKAYCEARNKAGE